MHGLLLSTYIEINPPWFLRLTLIADQPFDDQEFQKTLQFYRKDYGFTLETSLLYEWIVIPTLTIGQGLYYQKINILYTKNTGDQLSHSDILYYLYAQLGVGIPIQKGEWILEPFLRFAYAPEDPELFFGYGVHLSWLINES